MVKSSSSSEEKKLSPEIRSLRSRLFSFVAGWRELVKVSGRTVPISTFPVDQIILRVITSERAGLGEAPLALALSFMSVLI